MTGSSSPNLSEPNLLDIEDLWVRFPTRSGVFDAVRGISFSLGRERLGIVGESGSGKSMTGRALCRKSRCAPYAATRFP